MTTGEGDQRPSARTLVIIPTFNERENLQSIVDRVHQTREDVHVLIVDDGSPDGTGELADELALADADRVHVMHRQSKAGLGAAYLAGFAWGLNREYSVLVEMDADGSHPPEQLYRLLDAVDAGADLAIGSRYVRGGLEGLLLSDRPHLAQHQQRIRRRRGPDHVHRTRIRSIQDERIQHPRGSLQGCGMGYPRAAGPRPRRRRHALAFSRRDGGS